jgi:excisionase family DNA binding protein
MKNTAAKSPERPGNTSGGALSVTVDIDPLVEVVRRHVKLSPRTSQLIRSDFARLLHNPGVQVHTTRPAAPQVTTGAADAVLTTQEAADLVGVSRPYIVARIEAGDIPLHQQVGNQRRVLKSAVLAWQRREQLGRRKALARLGADLDAEIFAD